MYAPFPIDSDSDSAGSTIMAVLLEKKTRKPFHYGYNDI